jgi:hypothetical protein
MMGIFYQDDAQNRYRYVINLTTAGESQFGKIIFDKTDRS